MNDRDSSSVSPLLLVVSLLHFVSPYEYFAIIKVVIRFVFNGNIPGTISSLLSSEYSMVYGTGYIL